MTKTIIPSLGLYGKPAASELPALAHIESMRERGGKLGWHIKPHRHSRLYQILCVYDGELEIWIDDLYYHLKGSWVVTVPLGSVHSFLFKRDSEGMVLSIADQLLTDEAMFAKREPLGDLINTPQIVDFCNAGSRLAQLQRYLEAMSKELDVPAIPPGLLFAPPSLTAAEGESLSYSPEHQASLTGAYRLPLSADIGDIVLSATYVYTSQQQATANGVTPYATIPSYELLNLNLNWNSIAGTRMDAALFATNALEEEYYTFVSGQYNSTGFEARGVGQPRMVGARLRYNF